jgi:hypothetical protein
MKVFLVILCILAAIAVILALVLSLWVKLRVVYESGGELRVWAQLWFYRYHIIPVKQPKLKLRDYKIKRFRRLERKRALNAEKERLKSAVKQRSTVEPASETELKPSPELSLLDRLTLFTRLISKILKRFARYLRIDVSKLYIKVATGDAAGTAYLYSASVQSAAYITELLSTITNFDVDRRAEFSIEPDFCAAQSEFSADFTFKIRVLNLLKLGLSAFLGYTRVKKAVE